MKILVIGGTRFFGRAIVAEALERGHDVTLFHRGKTGPELFPKAKHILGDRDGDTSLLEGHQFDAVIDVCGYVPRIVALSVDALRKAGHYQFISTISVYHPKGRASRPLTEAWPLYGTEGVQSEEVTGESYGPLKVLCEQAVTRAFPNNSFHLRPGYIVGAHDPSDRFTHWVSRIGSEKRILVPTRLDQPIQVIDARDLAAFSVSATEQGLVGATHATGHVMTFGAMLAAIRDALGRTTEFVPHNTEEPGKDYPLSGEPDDDVLLSISIEKALGEGLKLRPLEETIRHTWDWSRKRGAFTPRTGISVEREREVLASLG